MDLERVLPGKELFFRQLVDTASLLDRDRATTHRGDHRGLSTDYPSLGVRMWQTSRERRPAQRFIGGCFHSAAKGRGGVQPRTSGICQEPIWSER